MISTFTAVWQSVLTFLVGIFEELTALFYANNELTFVGVMAVIMAGISLFLLVFNLIRSFFVMRG